MDWDAVTFDWNRARAFLVTAEEGSLSAAARALGLAQPTLSRQVDAFQREIGVSLFERFGRGLELTPAGEALLAHARTMGDGAMGLALAARGQGDAHSGPVTISASDAYAGLLLPPILKRLSAQEPGLITRILAENTTSDLMRHEADIAIRNFRPTEPDLIARRLPDAGANFYAARSYLDQHGPVTSAQNWTRAAVISPTDGPSFAAGLRARDIPMPDASIRYECASYLAMWEMVKQGLGIGLIDTQIGDGDPAVARAAPSQPDLPFPVWLVAHRDVLTNARLRRVYDALAEALGKRPG